MKTKTAETLLASAIFARSISFAINKIGLSSFSPFNILGIRFLLAFVIMVIIFNNRVRSMGRKELTSGIVIGTVFAAIMSFEMYALKFIDSSTEAFLENAAVVWVPALEVLFFIFTRKSSHLPEKTALIAAPVALAGVGFLTLKNGLSSFGIGELLGIISGLLYAAGIIVTERLTKDNDDPLLLGIIQLGTMGVICMAASFIFEAPHLPDTGSEWVMILILSVFCSCFGFAFQTFAQKYVSSSRTGVYAALSPLGAAFFGALMLHESFGPPVITGSALILLSILILRHTQK